MLQAAAAFGAAGAFAVVFGLFVVGPSISSAMMSTMVAIVVSLHRRNGDQPRSLFPGCGRWRRDRKERAHRPPCLPGQGGGAADAFQLFDHGFWRDAGAHCQRDERLAASVWEGQPPPFCRAGKDFTDAELVAIDGDIEIAATGDGLFRHPWVIRGLGLG